MAQTLPLEVFVDRKIKKWRERAASRNCRLVDGVGVSPLEEMIYIWSKFGAAFSLIAYIYLDLPDGYKKMNQENFDISLMALDYTKDEQDPDERAIRWLLMAVLHRRMEKLQEAKDMLERVMLQAEFSFTGLYHDKWMSTFASNVFFICRNLPMVTYSTGGLL